MGLYRWAACHPQQLVCRLDRYQTSWCTISHLLRWPQKHTRIFRRGSTSNCCQKSSLWVEVSSRYRWVGSPREFLIEVSCLHDPTRGDTFPSVSVPLGKHFKCLPRPEIETTLSQSPSSRAVWDAYIVETGELCPETGLDVCLWFENKKERRRQETKADWSFSCMVCFVSVGKMKDAWRSPQSKSKIYLFLKRKTMLPVSIPSKVWLWWLCVFPMDFHRLHIFQVSELTDSSRQYQSNI